MADYFLANSGSDSNSGLVGHPWQTLSKWNSTSIANDTLTMAAETFSGTLQVKSGQRIGTGRNVSAPFPDFFTGDTWTVQTNPATISFASANGFEAFDVEGFWLDNIAFVGGGMNTAPGIGGSLTSSQATNKLTGLRFTALSFTQSKDALFLLIDNGKKGWDDFQFWNIWVHHCQRLGLYVTNNGTFASGTEDQCSNFYLGGGSIFEDLPGLAGGTGVGNCGQGATLCNTTTGLIDGVLARRINEFGDQGSGGTGGIIVARCNGIVVNVPEIHDIYAPQPVPTDGVGVDFEGGARNCTLIGPYIHDCHGAAFLTGTFVAAATTGNKIICAVMARNNIKGHQAEIYNFGGHGAGASTNVQTAIENCTVYASNGDAYVTDPTGAHQEDSIYTSQLISAAGAFCVNGLLNGLIGCDYHAIGGGGIKVRVNGTTYTSLATLRAAGFEQVGGVNYGVFGDPLLNDPTGPTGSTLPDNPVSTIANYNFPVTSPAYKAGWNFGLAPTVLDFRGNQAVSGGLCDIGAVSVSGQTARGGSGGFP